MNPFNGRLQRSLVSVFVVGLSCVVLSSAAADVSGEIFDAAPHESSNDVAMPARYVEVLLRNGNVVGFVRMADARGKALGIGIYEIRSAGNGSINRLFDLDATDPVELFLALTSPGTKIPPIFGDMSRRTHGRASQGWALDELAGDTQASHDGDDCSDSWMQEFRAPLLSFGHTHADIVKSTGPDPDPWLWDESLSANYFGLQATGVDLRSVAMSVRWCGQDSTWPEPSLHIRFDVRHSDGWEQKVSVASIVLGNGDLRALAVGDQVNFHYAPYSVNNNGFDAKLRVDGARLDDLFHVGVSWTPASYGLKIE